MPGEKIRRFKTFQHGAASWDRAERIIARIEAGPMGVDTRLSAPVKIRRYLPVLI
jgi:hypothetical protein